MSGIQPPPPPPGTPPPPPPRPAPRPPPPYVDLSLLRPSTVWYWVAGAIGVASVAVAVALFVGFAGSLIDELGGPLTALRTPGEVTLELEPGAERAIYRQVREAGAPIHVSPGPEPTCTVTRVGGGAVEVGDAFDWTLKRDGDRYDALYDFEAPQGGSYAISCEDAGDPSRSVPLAIGQKVGLLSLFGRIVAILGVLFGGLVIAVTIVTVTVVRRDSHKRRLQHQALERGASGLG